jgi:hypothetical protein
MVERCSTFEEKQIHGLDPCTTPFFGCPSIKQQWQEQCHYFISHPLQKMLSLCYILLLPLRIFPQEPHIPHIMNLKNLYFAKFNFFMPTGIKVCWPCQAGYKKTFSPSFNCYNLKIYVVKNYWNFSHLFSYKCQAKSYSWRSKRRLSFPCPSSVYIGAIFHYFWRNIFKVFSGLTQNHWGCHLDYFEHAWIGNKSNLSSNDFLATLVGKLYTTSNWIENSLWEVSLFK